MDSKHEMHIDDGLKGFPPEWENSLLQLGYSPGEIQEMVAQKQRQRGAAIPINGPSGSSSSVASHHTNGSTSSTYHRYPTPPQQYALPVPQTLSTAYQPLTLQTDINPAFGDLEQYHPQKTNSPVTRAPLRNPIDRSDSPASSIRSNATNNQRERASPVPSLTREREHVLQSSNLSNSSHTAMPTTKAPAPVRPAPPPPLFPEGSISTSKANTYKPPRVIAVNGDEDSDDENQPLGALRSGNKQVKPVASAAARHGPAGSVSSVNRSQPVQEDNQGQEGDAQDAQDDTPTTASQHNTTAPVPAASSNASGPPLKSTLSAFDAPPRLSLSTLTIPRISLSLGSLELGLGLDTETKGKEATSANKDRGDVQSIEWSESLFAALPSATAFDGFRTSVIRTPGSGASSGRGSPASNYSPAGSGAAARPSPATLGQSPAISTSRGVSPQTGSTFGFGRGTSPAQSREPSPTTASTGMTLVAPNSSRSQGLSPSPTRELPSTLSPVGNGRSPLQAVDSPSSAPSQGRDLARESVSSYATERSSMSSFGETDYGEEHEDDEGVAEAVVVTRATAVKLARAPSMALHRTFDVFASGNPQAPVPVQGTADARGVVGQASAQVVNNRSRGGLDAGMPPYAALQAQRMLYQNAGFDEEDEGDEDSDEDSDEIDEDDEDDPDSRYTIRLGDADAGRLMDAVMKGGGVLDAQQQKDLNATSFGGDASGRPLSTATIRKEGRPVSEATLQGTKVANSQDEYLEEQLEEGEDDEDSSALDEWLEANDSEDPEPSSPAAEDTTVTISPGRGLEGSEYDDADHPLLDAYTNDDVETDYGDRSPESIYEVESIQSPADPGSAQSFDEDNSPGSDAIPDSPYVLGAPSRTRGLSKSSQNSSHTRTPGVGSGSGSSAAGSNRPKRSSVIYSPPSTQLSPQQRDILKPVLTFIRSGDPSTIYGDLQQVAEGESGGIYAALVLSAKSSSVRVAIKKVRVEDATRPKMETLKREMGLFSRIRHDNILSYGEMRLWNNLHTELWVRMELMERSLADLLGLISEGLVLEERHVARFAKDAASGLAYLEKLLIAHRDIRSDNILVSGNDGCAKLGTFDVSFGFYPLITS